MCFMFLIDSSQRSFITALRKYKDLNTLWLRPWVEVNSESFKAHSVSNPIPRYHVPCHIATWGFHCSMPWLVWESWDLDGKTWATEFCVQSWDLSDCRQIFKFILDQHRDVMFQHILMSRVRFPSISCFWNQPKSWNPRSNKALLRHFCNQAAVDISPYSLEVWQSKPVAWSLRSNKVSRVAFWVPVFISCFPGWKPCEKRVMKNAVKWLREFCPLRSSAIGLKWLEGGENMEMHRSRFCLARAK